MKSDFGPWRRWGSGKWRRLSSTPLPRGNFCLLPGLVFMVLSKMVSKSVENPAPRKRVTTDDDMQFPVNSNVERA